MAAVSDTFVGSALTELSTHSPDVGGAWNKSVSFANDLVLNGSGGVYSTGNALYYNSTLPASADYSVFFRVRGGTIAGAVGVMFRRSFGGGHETFMWVYTDGSNWRLYWNIDTGFTQIGSDVAQALSINTDYDCEVRLSGTSIQLYVNTVLKINATDSNVTGNGTAGPLGLGASSSSNLQLSNFSIVNSGTSVDGATIASGAAVNVPTIVNSGAVTGVTIAAGAVANAPALTYTQTILATTIASGALLNAATIGQSYNVVADGDSITFGT
jgi:hypothetical protein